MIGEARSTAYTPIRTQCSPNYNYTLGTISNRYFGVSEMVYGFVITLAILVQFNDESQFIFERIIAVQFVVRKYYATNSFYRTYA